MLTPTADSSKESDIAQVASMLRRSPPEERQRAVMALGAFMASPLKKPGRQPKKRPDKLLKRLR